MFYYQRMLMWALEQENKTPAQEEKFKTPGMIN